MPDRSDPSALRNSQSYAHYHDHNPNDQAQAEDDASIALLDSDAEIKNSILPLSLTPHYSPSAVETDAEALVPRRSRSRSRSRWSSFCIALSPWLCRRPTGWLVEKFAEDHHNSSSVSRAARLRSRRGVCLCTLVGFLMMLGLFQIGTLIVGVLVAFFPDDTDRLLHLWRPDSDHGHSHLTLSSPHWSTDSSVLCHSHNDYWRIKPLYTALAAGCSGVEADVWLFDNELYVGHSTSALTPDRTLKNLYVDPLLEILAVRNEQSSLTPATESPVNGVFESYPSQTLVLLIDFKTAGAELWPYVVDHLSALREKHYLSYYNGTDVTPGPITVVATGNAPFDLLTANTTYRDIFFDAPLDLLAMEETTETRPPPLQTLVDFISQIPAKEVVPVPVAVAADLEQSVKRNTKRQDQGQGRTGITDVTTDIPHSFNAENSYYASVSFKASIGYPWWGILTERKIDLIRSQIRGAHARGLKVRYWGVPAWPRWLRHRVWRVLVDEGVDFLNVDDVRGESRGRWRRDSWW